MDGTPYDWNPRDGRPKLAEPGPFAAEMQDRQRAIAQNGAEPWNDPVEVRRARRRRDLELLRLGAMEAAFHMVDHVAGRLPAWKGEVFQHVKDPLASLANLNRAVIQITLAEDRLDETDEERALRIKTEAEAEARARHDAETARLAAEVQIRRAANQRQVEGAVRAITLSSLNLNYYDREKLLTGLFKELEAGDAYDRDPQAAVTDLCLRLGIGPKNKGADAKFIIERRAALAEVARAHLEALRGPQDVDEDGEPTADEPAAPFIHAAKAQGPPN
jgi:hypothetical protein